MKRKDFLRKMRDRRRGGGLEERQPARRRMVDWRTLRVDLPAEGEDLPDPEPTPVGKLFRLTNGVRLEPDQPCWVRGYRLYDADDGLRAEFQYKLAEEGAEAPPGATAVTSGDSWEPNHLNERAGS